MTATYNHLYDLYIKTKGSSGAISGGYTFQVDGSSNLNGNLNVVGTINNISSTVFNYIANLASDAQAQLNSLSSSITAINTTLTGISYSGATLMQTIIPNVNATKYYLSGTQLTNIGNTQYLDISSSLTTQLAGKTTLSAVQSNNNAFTGTTTFNTSLPTSTLTPSSSTQLITKNYGDSTYATITNLASANTNIATNTTNITNLNTILTGASWNATYNYLNLANNLDVYGTLKLNGLSTDVSSTFSNIYSTLGTLTTLSNVLSSNNAWSGTNSFNSSLPTSTLSPSSSTQLITKSYGDTTYANSAYLTSSLASVYSTISSLTSNNNVWSGTNSFNTSLPTSTVTPTTSTQLITKSYADSIYTTLSNVLSNNNAFTGTCTFNTSLPTSTVTPTTSTQLITKAYADSNYSASGGTTLSAVQSNNNVFTGTNTFNTSLPTSTVTPSSSTQLVTKTYVDTQVATKQNTLSNASYLDSTSSTQGQLNTINTTLSTLQPIITGSTNLSFGNLQLNTSSSTTPILQLYGYGGGGSSVSINLDTYYSRSGGPASVIKAIDNGNASNDIVFYTATQGSQSTVTSERMRIYASGAINMTGALSCNNLNFNTGSLYSDGNEMWVYNNNLSYASNFALFQSNTGNTIINASSG